MDMLQECADFDELVYTKKIDINTMRNQSLVEDRVVSHFVNTKFNIYEDHMELVYYKKNLKINYSAPKDMREAAYYNDGLICECLEDKFSNNSSRSRLFYYDEDNNLILNNKDLTFSEALERSKFNCKRSRIRMLNQLYSYSLCNTWDAFLTLTFDRKKVDSSNFKEVNYAYNLFIKRLKYVFPDIKALFVAEYHKDKEHIHFHGFLGNCPNLRTLLTRAVNPYTNEELTDKVGNTVFNFTDNNFWDFGFATIALLEDGYNKLKVANYLTKYIGKDINLEYGAKGLLHTNNLNCRTSFNAMLSKEDLMAIIESYYAKHDTVINIESDIHDLSIFKKETDSLLVFNLYYKSCNTA